MLYERCTVSDHQKNVGEAVTSCIMGQIAEFLRGPNLSSPIKAIGAQQSGLIAQWLVRAKLIGCNV